MSISISTLADRRRFADAGPRPFLPVNVLVAVAAISLALGTPHVTQAQGAEEEIKATLVDMWDALEHGDLERYASHVHDDFTSFGENDRYLNEGKDYDLRGNRNWLSQTKGVHTDMHQPQVTVRGDMAWITYYWTDYGDLVDGGRYSSEGKSTRIFVREDGRWLCIHGHYTLAP